MARGQITVFIIVGIVLLAGFGLITYFVNFSVEESLQTEALPVMDKVSQEFEPIQDFVLSCMNDGIASGIKKLSEGGGYLYPDLLGTWDPIDYTDAPGVQLGSTYVPYWSHSTIPFDDGMNRVYTYPSLNGTDTFAIDRQLESYVDEYIESCVNNFAVFTQYDIGAGQREVDVLIFEEEVHVYLVMPLTIKRGEVTSTMTNFVLEFDSDFKRLYESAVEITQFQHDYHYFEYLLKEVMPLYQGTSQEDLPPYLMATVGNPEYANWDQYLVQQRLRGILNQYMNMVRYAGNPDVPYTTYDGEYGGLITSTYEKFQFPLANGDHYVKFDYFNFNPALTLNNGAQEVGGSHTAVSSPFSEVSFNIKSSTYMNSYDISWPVVVTLDSEDGLAGQPLTFMFALEGLIANNEDVTGSTIAGTYAPSEELQLLCDERQHTVSFNTTVVDFATREAIEADVLYTVDGAGSCYAGSTGGDTFTFSAPTGYGIIVTLEAEGYLTQHYTFNFEESGELGFTLPGVQGGVLPMYRGVELPVNLTFLPVTKCVMHRDVVACKDKAGKDNTEDCMDVSLGRICTANGGQSLFDQNPIFTTTTKDSNTMQIEYYLGFNTFDAADKKVMATFTRTADEFGEAPNMRGEDVKIFISGNEPQTIYPGTYDVSYMMVKEFNQTYVMQNETRCTGTKDRDCYVVDKIELDNMIMGIYQLEDVVISSDDLYSATIMEIPVAGVDIPYPHTVEMPDYNVSMLVFEEFAFLADMTSALEYYPNRLAPRWTYE